MKELSEKEIAEFVNRFAYTILTSSTEGRTISPEKKSQVAKKVEASTEAFIKKFKEDVVDWYYFVKDMTVDEVYHDKT